MLINIRGAFGSGKTTIAKSLLPSAPPLRTTRVLAEAMVLKETKADPNRMIKKLIHGIEINNGNGIVIGTYANACGGLDEYSWKGAHDTIVEAIRQAAKDYPVVVYEGVTVSGIYGRYADLATDLHHSGGGRESAWVFTMPPAQTCLERVALRSGAGITDRNTSSVFDKWRAIKRVHDKAVEERPLGVRTYWHDSTEDAQEQVESLIASVLAGA